MSALFDFKGYDNFVLAEKIKSILITKMDMNRYMTADYSLSEHPGMVKKIHKYIGSGNVEDLDRGDGNTQYIDAEFTEEEYRVKRTQGATRYYDDDQMTDPVLVDTKVSALAEEMVNDWTRKSLAEYAKTQLTSEFTDWGLANFADAIAVYSNQYEDQNGLFFICAQDLIPTIRKALGDYLKYTEAYIRTGAIGEVLGVPIYTTKALSGVMYMATKEAVTAFFKKDVFVEQERDPNVKLNTIYASRYTVIALTDGTRCVECGKAQTKAATVASATKAQKTVSGQATTGATVQAYVNGKASGVAVTAASNAYSITVADNLVAGDKVYVIATLAGNIKSISEVFTVAE